MFSKLGSKVTFVTSEADILLDVESSASRLVKLRFKKLGIDLKIKTQVINSKTTSDGMIELQLKGKEGKEKIKTSHVFVNGNKIFDKKTLCLQRSGVALDYQGFISTNEKQQTNVSHIFAVGDCTGKPFSAHRAIKQGIIASEVIAGLFSEYDFRSMPKVIFTDPEIAIAGLSESEAKTQGHELVISRSNYGASGRALTQLSNLGYVKHIRDKNSGVILGVTIVGALASELISEVSIALEMGALAEDIDYSVHPHPTLSEILMESAKASLGKAIHQVNKN
jgi:dihydrolipoamide dehydrogenase